MKRSVLTVLTLVGFCLTGFGQQADPFITLDSLEQEKWVESTIAKMSLDEKIGQLFMVDVYSDDREDQKAIKKMLRKYHVGGLVFFQGTPQRQAELTNIYQRKSDIPLMIGFDGEWGLDMRLKGSFKYPFNMTLGAVQDNGLVEQFGRQIGKHHKRIGIHIDFAPVVDININPNNPIIGNRSFGEVQENVTQKAEAVIRGMQSAGVLANAKHFPGHGDTSTDSHKALPFLDFDRSRLDAVELYPYYRLMETDLASVMVGHLNVPSLVGEQNLPTSLSYEVVTELLQNEMGFKGLVFTDALNMKGAANYGGPGAVDLKAFLAGNDMLLYTRDVKSGFNAIKKAYKEGAFDMQRLDRSVRKILKAKYWSGLAAEVLVDEDGIAEDIHTATDDVLKERLFEEAITVIKDEDLTLPIRDIQNKKFAYLHVGDDSGDAYLNALRNYQAVDAFDQKDSLLLQNLKGYDHVFIGFHRRDDKFFRSYEMNQEQEALILSVAAQNTVSLTTFTSPYSLKEIKDFSNFNQVLVAYQNDVLAQQAAAEIIFGSIGAKGRLPVSIGSAFDAGFGIDTGKLNRLSYTSPERVGMDASRLKKVDELMQKVIDSEMAPGLVVLAARDGKIFYHKALGSYTYENEQDVELNTVYDLASVTKILGGLPMMMKAYESGAYDLETTLGDWFKPMQGSNKDTVTMKQALSHVGRIQAWIPYYKETVDSISLEPLTSYYQSGPSSNFSLKVAQNLYLNNSYKDSIIQRIKDAPQREEIGYKYSGLLFYLMKFYLEDLYKEDLSNLNESYFYDKIGAYTLGYNPLKQMDKKDIAPTELDDYYRHQLLQGDVHDMGAAMMGGVSGNAGLFGSALDVAKMMQMYLNFGSYGGEQYLESNTLRTFAKRYYEKDSVRRGLGFDKPSLDPEISSSAESASDLSFGHSGFTGTFAWADPSTGLVYVFLSNRVYPKMDNNKLGEANIRTRIHEAFYKAMKN